MKDKHELTKIKNKYYLSFSTIIDIIATPMDAICRKNNLYDKKELEDRHGLYKTSVKPKNFNNNMTARQYSIATKLFIRGKYKEYLTEQELQNCNNMIYKYFRETHDDNWNGNQLSRFIPKFCRQNKEYMEKILNGD